MARFKISKFEGNLPLEIEKRYRLDFLNEDRKQILIGIILSIILLSIFVFNDFILFKNNPILYYLIVYRAIFIIYSTILIIGLKFIKDPKKMDLHLLVWGLFGVIFIAIINYTRPSSYIGHAVIDTVIILIFYMGIPVNLLSRLIPAVLFTIANIILFLFFKTSSAIVNTFSIVFTLLLVNAIGIYLSKKLYSYRRSQYLANISEENIKKELKKLASTDYLTGILNLRAFIEQSKKELVRSKRYAKTFSIIMIDLDHFKELNDTHGHLYGDIVLKKMVEVVKPLIRQLDIFGRLGGEEFYILLIETDINKAKIIAKRILNACSEAEVLKNNSGEKIKFTVSIGISESTVSDNEIEQIIHRADMAMYRAKTAGRNRIET